MELGCDYGDLGFDPEPESVLVPDPSQDDRMSGTLFTRPSYSFKMSEEASWWINSEPSPLYSSLSTIPSLG